MRPQGGTQAGFPQVHGLMRVPKTPEGNLSWPYRFIPSWAYTDEGPGGERGTDGLDQMRDPSVGEEDGSGRAWEHISDG